MLLSQKTPGEGEDKKGWIGGIWIFIVESQCYTGQLLCVPVYSFRLLKLQFYSKLKLLFNYKRSCE